MQQGKMYYFSSKKIPMKEKIPDL